MVPCRFIRLEHWLKAHSQSSKILWWQSDQLPLAEVLDEQEFTNAFRDHGVTFGEGDDAVYTPAITLWGTDFSGLLRQREPFVQSCRYADRPFVGCARTDRL